MTDEIVDEFGMDSEMLEFYTCGPKSYTYKVKTSDGTTVTKIKAKGLSQTVSTLDTLNFREMRRHAIFKSWDKVCSVSTVPQMQFRRNKYHEVRTVHVNKIFQATSDKRRIVGNNTVPYGFQHEINYEEVVDVNNITWRFDGENYWRDSGRMSFGEPVFELIPNEYLGYHRELDHNDVPRDNRLTHRCMRIEFSIDDRFTDYTV